MRTVLMLLIGSGFAFAAPVPKDRKKQESIVGAWAMQESKMLNQEGLSGYTPQTWTFTEDGKMNIAYSAGVSLYTFKEDLGQAPAQFEFLFRNSNLSLGIFKIEGDTLTICYSYGNAARPADFTGKGSGTNCVLCTFKRVEK